MMPFSFFRRGLALVSILALVGAGCTKGPTPEAIKASQPVTLDIWGVIDDVDVYAKTLDTYRKMHPNIQINYRRLRLEEYEQKMLEGMAEDRGPDIFLIHHDWVTKYQSRITPMPKTTEIGYSVTTGTIKKEKTWEARIEPTITLKDYRTQYADVVLRDTIRTVNVSEDPLKQDLQERIVALPVSLDTLGLYYNKDLLNAAGIPNPPETWQDFQDQVKKIVKFDQENNILQAAAGIGTARNVERSTDILTVLMMQNGARMTDDAGNLFFHVIPPELSGQREEPPSYSALTFYTDFANPSKETYTWNGQQPNSLDAFVQGKTAFFFGYAYHLPQIRARAPKLNLGITKLPQIEGNPVKNLANYWAWTVSKKTKNPAVAWNLVNYMGQPEQNKQILDQMKRPAVRKSMLKDQLEDESIGVFASQVLTATTWYRGKDPQTMENAFTEMIEQTLLGVPMGTTMKQAIEKISQTMY
jgi:ABC-type glycerol-3-phosphate transport system substrate-binding protein